MTSVSFAAQLERVAEGDHPKRHAGRRQGLNAGFTLCDKLIVQRIHRTVAGCVVKSGTAARCSIEAIRGAKSCCSRSNQVRVLDAWFRDQASLLGALGVI